MYMYVDIHTYITLHYITLHYITLQYIHTYIRKFGHPEYCSIHVSMPSHFLNDLKQPVSGGQNLKGHAPELSTVTYQSAL